MPEAINIRICRGMLASSSAHIKSIYSHCGSGSRWRGVLVTFAPAGKSNAGYGQASAINFFAAKK